MTKALQEAPALANVTFTMLIGKGNSGSSVTVGPTAGMSGKKQAQVVDAFREPGGWKVRSLIPRFSCPLIMQIRHLDWQVETSCNTVLMPPNKLCSASSVLNHIGKESLELREV